MAAMRKHFSAITGHQRLICGVVVGVIVALFPLPIAIQSKGLLAWSAGAMTYLALA
jgi:hypothetical protein